MDVPPDPPDPNPTQRVASGQGSFSSRRRIPSFTELAEGGVPIDATYRKYLCHAAAIYLDQGNNNEKFFTHPQSPVLLPAYLLVHNRWFHIIDLVASVVLLLLALIEQPHYVLYAPIWLHSCVELVCLFLIGLELAVRLYWLGTKQFLCHKRTMIKCLCLLVLFVEALVVLAREAVHVRVTRAFRPLFLIDSRYCHAVRRFMRQIILSLGPVLDMLVILLSIMFVFSVIGYYLFGSVDKDYFGDPTLSFVSLFVLLTSANFPNVMMAAYAHNRWSSLFFVTYICVEMYFVMNLLLAVVYDTFTNNEKTKFRKLYLHRREGCRRAFEIVADRDRKTSNLSDVEIGVGHHAIDVSAAENEGIQFPDPTNKSTYYIGITQFAGLMKYFAPSKNLKDIYLCFKSLNKSGSNRLALEEFYRVYEISKCGWKHKHKVGLRWFSDLPGFVRIPMTTLELIVKSKVFSYSMYVVSLAVGLFFFAETYLQESNIRQFHRLSELYDVLSFVFTIVFMAECLVKMLGLGIYQYFRLYWNVLDFVVTVVALVGAILPLFGVNTNFSFLIVLRFLDLLRPMEYVRQTYRDISKTINILVPRLISAAVVFLNLFYFFAIIGMESFGNYDLRDCCNNTAVESSFVYSGFPKGYFYLNDFKNILRSGVTLFELTVVNNWYIMMEGFVWVTNEWTRLYFMSFFIATMVVLTIVVAFILETFLFRIKCSRESRALASQPGAIGNNALERDRTTTENAGANNEDQFGGQFYHAEVLVSSVAMAMLCSRGDTIDAAEMEAIEEMNRTRDEESIFVGTRAKDRFDFSTELYSSELLAWIAEDDANRLAKSEAEVPGRENPAARVLF